MGISSRSSISPAISMDGRELVRVADLVHLEQRVNERLGTDPPPQVSAELLPEAGVWRPLAWARVQRDEVDVLSDDAGQRDALTPALDGGNATLLFPLHPLVEQAYPPTSLVRRGRFAVSASYRTVFYEPDPDSLLMSLVPAEHVMMIKLHLDDPLPGIAGDRRLTPEKVRKCVELSSLLPGLLGADDDSHAPVTVLRERFGLLHGERGAIIRFVPRQGLVPAFALYSRDSTSGAPPLIVSALKQLDWQPEVAAVKLADWLARPILSAVLAGIRNGFSLEMHGQNTLIELLPDGQVGEVCFRDLESVVYFPELRARHGLAPLDLGHLGAELFQEPRNPTRWFNRNIDHDVGRIFRCTLQVLEREGVFGKHLARIATRRIQATARELIASFGVDVLARQGRWLPFSRSPYGNGRRRGHYYRTTFR